MIFDDATVTNICDSAMDAKKTHVYVLDPFLVSCSPLLGRSTYERATAALELVSEPRRDRHLG